MVMYAGRSSLRVDLEVISSFIFIIIIFSTIRHRMKKVGVHGKSCVDVMGLYVQGRF